MPPFESINDERRRLFGVAATTIVAAQFASFPTRSGAEPAGNVATGAASPIGPVRQINAGPLSVGYVDIGPADGPTVILLHGWPYDIQSFAEAGPALAANGYRVIAPYMRGFGPTRFLSADTFRNGQPSAVALDAVATMDALNIKSAILAGFDLGARSADIIAALWPERCKGLVSVSGYLISNQAAGAVPLPPEAEYQWWYQFYFATDRGKQGYAKNRSEFNKLIWRLASPKWSFDDATYARTAASFDNPDHVDVVIHNYRWRQGLAQGESKYDEVEAQLAAAPVIRVPTITMEGDANGAPHPEPSAYANKFVGRYEHRTIAGGIGHNLPQEAPAAFARAVVDVHSWS
jgi:pimeloyl-ACP methyl ester carboxylesterase